jgi:hypothetical protein
MCASVSDGSFKEQPGTAAWSIEAESSVHRCTGEKISPAAESLVNRYTGVNIVPGAPTANLKVWLQKQRTQPGIITVLCAKLLAWQKGSTEDIPVGTFHDLLAFI